MIDEIVDLIYSDIYKDIKDDWPKINKIRYVYLILGKYLEKNTDFFLNDKLEDLKINDNEVMSIYKDNKINIRELNKGKKQYQIICRSAAIILQKLLKKFGVDSQLIVTCGNEDEIRHWFLTAIGDNNEQYFLTLAADLPYIKNNLRTRHFANSISLINVATIREDKNNSVSVYDKLLERIKVTSNDIDKYVAVKNDENIFVIYERDLKHLNIKTNNVEIIKLTSYKDEINKLDSVTFVGRQYEIEEGLSLNRRTRVINGIEVEYDEIAYTDLNPRDDRDTRLHDIDQEIGYYRIYESEELFAQKNFNELFYVLTEERSELFELLNNCLNIGDDYSKRIDDITEEEVKKLINELNNYVAGYLNYYFNVDSFNKDNYFREFFRINNFNYNEEVSDKSNLKSVRKKINDIKLKDLFTMLLNIVNIEDRFIEFINVKKELETLENKINELINSKNYSSEDEVINLSFELYDLELKYEKVSKSLSISELNPMLNRTAYYFLINGYGKNRIVNLKEKEYISLNYIYNKFCLMFATILDCNYEGLNETMSSSSFSDQGYSEQVVIIKEILKNMFPELNPVNCSKFAKYNPKYSPVENRIRVYPLKDRKTGEYIIGFRFWALDDTEEEMNLLYIPSQNLLREYTLGDNSRYLIISSSVSKYIDAIEDIEEDEIEEEQSIKK